MSGVIRICCLCRRACAGSREHPVAFGRPWTDAQQVEASRTALVSHGVCAACEAALDREIDEASP